MKKTNELKGKIELVINGVKYIGVVELQAERKTKQGEYPVWGVRIDRKNSDPEAAVEYIGTAEGYTPANGANAGSWADNPIFAKIKPCLMKNGKVATYLNPDNYKQAADGSSVEALRGYFDTMIEFGKMFYRISQDDRYTYVEVAESEKSLADGFTDRAFSYKGKVRDRFYIGAYLGYTDNEGALRSVSGHIPTGDLTIGQFREAAHRNGNGYEILAFNKLVLLQALYLIRYKSLDSRSALGKGWTEADDYAASGDTDALGLYYGEDNGESRVKCHGLEDFYGNKLQWVDGFITTDKIAVSDGNFNDTGDGYETAAALPKSVYGVILDVHGDNVLGFTPKKADDDKEVGSGYYCNYGSTWTDDSGYLPYFGGSRSGGASAGAFYLSCRHSASLAYAYVGARLAFYGAED